jgi:hypothetical protein
VAPEGGRHLNVQCLTRVEIVALKRFAECLIELAAETRLIDQISRYKKAAKYKKDTHSLFP